MVALLNVDRATLYRPSWGKVRRKAHTGDDSILLLPQIPCFALMTNRKNQGRVLTFLQAIKGHVAGTSVRYDQLTQSILHRSADKGVSN